MILEFSIENFGCIREKQTLSFEPVESMPLSDFYVIQCGKYRVLKMALLYGANASGKSTLLKAIDFLRDLALNPLTAKNEHFDKLEPFKLTSEVKRDTIMNLVYIHDNVKYQYRVELNRDYIVSETLEFVNPESKRDKYTLICSRSTNPEKQTVAVEVGPSFKNAQRVQQLNNNILWNTSLFSSFLKSNTDFPEMKSATAWFTSAVMPLISAQTNLKDYTAKRLTDIGKDAIVDIMRKADFSIADITQEEKEVTVPSRLQMLLKSENGLAVKDSYKETEIGFVHQVGDQKFWFPYDEESDGTQKYFNLSGVLYQLVREEKIFLVDELETSLHPDLFMHFILTHLKNSKNSQLIVATHNREFLGERDLLRNDVVWFTDKNERKETELFSLADFGTGVVRKTSNVLNAYKIGKFGAKPTIVDHEMPTAHEKD